MVVVAAHQPNFLPGMSVVEKIRQADRVIWLDRVQFAKGGWINRNRVAGAWVTVPIDRATDGEPIAGVGIADRPWRARVARTLEQHLGDAAGPLVAEVLTPYRRLVSLNVAVLARLLPALEVRAAWHFQSHLDSGEAVTAVGGRRELAPISVRLAGMVAELGGDVYLSGPSGRGYLDETPFLRLGIRVDYFRWDGPNPSSAEALAGMVAA